MLTFYVLKQKAKQTGVIEMNYFAIHLQEEAFSQLTGFRISYEQSLAVALHICPEQTLLSPTGYLINILYINILSKRNNILSCSL